MSSAVGKAFTHSAHSLSPSPAFIIHSRSIDPSARSESAIGSAARSAIAGQFGSTHQQQRRERSGPRSSMMMGTDVCSSRMLSLPRYESGDEELTVLPRHTKVIVTGNNRTKSVLVGLQGVVKKAVGLGGWHWLVLKNGVEVKLQRNALSVLEAPTGNEDDDEIDGNNSFCSSFDMGEKDMNYSSIEYQKPTKPRVRRTRPSSSCTMSSSRGNFHLSAKLRARVNLTKLGTPTLWRYWNLFNLVSMNPSPSEEQLIHGVQQHFQSQQLDEFQVILGFIQAAKRLKTLYNS